MLPSSILRSFVPLSLPFPRVVRTTVYASNSQERNPTTSRTTRPVHTNTNVNTREVVKTVPSDTPVQPVEHNESAPPITVTTPTPPAASAMISHIDRSIHVPHQLDADHAHDASHKVFLARSRLRARSMLDRWSRRVPISLRTPKISRTMQQTTASSTIPHAPASPAPVRQTTKMSVEDAVGLVLHPHLVRRFKEAILSRFGAPTRVGPLIQRWRRILVHLLALGGASTGNSVIVYSDGRDAFQAMWKEIQEAKVSIRMESYIVEPDGVGRKTLRLLTEAAKRGVDVRFCFDSWGSYHLLHTRGDLDALEAAGAQIVTFNPIWHLFVGQSWRNSLMYRNHRKVLVVDGRVGFCGGMNVSSDYYSLSTDDIAGTGKFRDTHLRVEGPAVQDLLAVSRDTFQEASHVTDLVWREKERREREKKAQARRDRGWYPKRATSIATVDPPLSEVPLALNAPAPSAAAVPSTSSDESSCPLPPHLPGHDLFVQVLPSNVWRNKRLIQRAMLLTVREAKESILITNPYFFPPPSLFKAIQLAAKRGVLVRVIMAGEGKTDVPVTRWASQHIYHTLLRSGIEIFELQSATLHAKTVIIDGLYSSIGSFNWDRISARRNLEVNLTILDPCIAQMMRTHFDADLTHCNQVTRESLKTRNIFQRLLHRLAYYIMRWI